MANEAVNGNPYVGPRPFDLADRTRFFGRDCEASGLLSLVVAHRAMLLYAQSGAGKTSLVNAGLVPLLEKDGFEVLPVARVQGRIPDTIHSAQVPNPYVLNTLISWAEATADPKVLLPLSLADFIKGRPHLVDGLGLPAPRVAIFDQFEELFTHYQERWQDREDFFKQVRDALEADPLLRTVLVVREDHIAQIDPYVALLPEKLRTRFRLERLREAAALDAVKRPLEGTGCRFAEGVAEKLVQNLLLIRVAGPAGPVESPGEFVEPVQLQVVCSSIWRPDVAEITAEYLEQFGAVDKALANFYENAVRSAAAETGIKEALVRTWCEQALVTPLGTRNMVLEAWATTEGLANTAVYELERQRLIRREERAGARWWELTHDRLINPIQDANAAWRERESAKRWRFALQVAGIVAAIFIVLLALGLPAVTGRQVEQSVGATVSVVAGTATESAQQVAVTVQAAETVAATRQAQQVREQAEATVTLAAWQAEVTVTRQAQQAEATAARGAEQVQDAVSALLVSYGVTEPVPLKSTAILIGVGQFLNPSMPSLRGPPNDVSAMRDALLSRNSRLKVSILLNKDATRDNIEKTVWSTARSLPPAEPLLVYLGGQTGVDVNNLHYFAPFDYSEGQDTLTGTNAIEFRAFISQTLATHPKSVFIIDGAFDPTQLPSNLVQSAAIMTAGDNPGLIYEISVAGEYHGAFTSALVKTLLAAPKTSAVAVQGVYSAVRVLLKSYSGGPLFIAGPEASPL